MFRARYYNQRAFSAYFFDGGLSTEGTANYFKARYYRPKYFTTLSSNEEGPPSVTLVASSIAIEVLPSTVERNSPVTIIAYVYDQYNKPMEGVQVSFGSSVPSVLSIPAPGATDSLGRVVKTANTFTTGTTNLSATVGGYTAYTSVVVTSSSGGVVSNLSHGATIQPGNAGGGSPGPIRIKLVKRVKRWPTR